MSLTAPSLADFRVRFPDLERINDARVSDALSGAALECNADQYRELYSEAVLYLAAHRISSGPYGQPQRSKDAGKITIYQQHYERLQALAGGGFRVI